MQPFRKWSLRSLFIAIAVIAAFVAYRAHAYRQQIRAARLIESAGGMIYYGHHFPMVYDSPRNYATTKEFSVDGRKVHMAHTLTIPRRSVRRRHPFIRHEYGRDVVYNDPANEPSWSWLGSRHDWSIHVARLPLASIDDSRLQLLNSLPNLRCVEVTGMTNVNEVDETVMKKPPPSPDQIQLKRLGEVIDALPHVEVIGEFVYLSKSRPRHRTLKLHLHPMANNAV